jgi:flagellar export protein FliJ
MAQLVADALRWARMAGERLAAAQSEVDARRAELVRAAQDRRALERLEEMQGETAARESRAAEARRLDDLGSIYHLWRRAGEDSDR